MSMSSGLNYVTPAIQDDIQLGFMIRLPVRLYGESQRYYNHFDS